MSSIVGHLHAEAPLRERRALGRGRKEGEGREHVLPGHVAERFARSRAVLDLALVESSIKALATCPP